MKLRGAGVLVLCMLVLSACKYQKVTDTQQFGISESFSKLVIISEVGDVKIQSGTEAGVAVKAEKFANGRTTAQAQQYLDQIEVSYAVDNNTCTITVTLPEDQPHYVNGGANLTITGVKDLPLDIALNVGTIQCDTMNGGTIANNVGDITVTAATGDIELATDTGDIDVGDYSGGKFSLSADVGKADIKVSGSGALDGSIKTGVGNIGCEISNARSAGAELNTGVGKITITGITDFTIAGFVSRQASFDLGAAEGALTMETGTGNIDVTVF
jgi:hypothetical protein